jgi:carboxymethylenebutenolidase
MCYSDDARPPLPPVGGAASDHGELRLISSDGTRFLAYAARSASPSGRGVVVLPDARGLHQFYKEFAVRLAGAGFEAVVLDYFGRTAQDDNRSDGFDWKPHLESTTPEQVAADVRACLDYLTTPDGGRPSTVFSVGFCFGGATSWRQSAHNREFAGCIGFYGGQPLERVGPWIPQMHSPVLMLLAGEDFTTPEEFAEFATKVRGVGVEVETHTYPGAPHAFFDRRFVEHQQACEDAWRRILDFTERHSRVVSGA